MTGVQNGNEADLHTQWIIVSFVIKPKLWKVTKNSAELLTHCAKLHILAHLKGHNYFLVVNNIHAKNIIVRIIWIFHENLKYTLILGAKIHPNNKNVCVWVRVFGTDFSEKCGPMWMILCMRNLRSMRSTIGQKNVRFRDFLFTNFIFELKGDRRQPIGD